MPKKTQDKEKKALKKLIRDSQKSEAAKDYSNAFINLKSLMGNTWARYYCVIGSAQSGKSYSVAKLILNAKKRLHDKVKIYWLRLSETSVRALLQDNAAKLIDADLCRKFDLQLKSKGSEVYNVNSDDKTPFVTVLPLSTVYSKKGVAYFDKDFDGEYIIVLDEMNRDTYAGEKVTFDITYNFKRTLENLIRNSGSKQSKAKRTRVIMLGNTMSEASDLLLSFGFIPNPGDFGRYKIRTKKLILDYLPLSQAYMDMRKDSTVDIIQANNEAGFTNEVEADLSLIDKRPGGKPVCIIKFTDYQNDWFTLWNNGVVRPYNKEEIKSVIAMRRYIQNTIYNKELVDNVYIQFDARGYKYCNYYTYVSFRHELQKLKPQR